MGDSLPFGSNSKNIHKSSSVSSTIKGKSVERNLPERDLNLLLSQQKIQLVKTATGFIIEVAIT